MSQLPVASQTQLQRSRYPEKPIPQLRERQSLLTQSHSQTCPPVVLTTTNWPPVSTAAVGWSAAVEQPEAAGCQAAAASRRWKAG